MAEQLLPSSGTTGTMFLPVTTDLPDHRRSDSGDVLSGISFIFPDGTQVNIRHGSAKAVMSFLKFYQKEELPCLD